jgi:ParB/RepB/Spo0J family partition protein
MNNATKEGRTKSTGPVAPIDPTVKMKDGGGSKEARRLQDLVERRVEHSLEARPPRSMDDLLGLGATSSLPAAQPAGGQSTPVAEVVVPSTMPAVSGSTLVIRDIPVDAIIRSAHQPRTYMNDDEHEHLVASIREHGVLQPVKVRPTSTGQYMLIFGERRWLASKASGRLTIPAIVEEVSESESAMQTMIENVQRADLAPLDVARGYQSLLDQFHLTIEDLASRIGVTASQIKHATRILQLPAAILEKVLHPTVGLRISHAEELLTLKDNPVRLGAIADRLVKEKWTQERLRSEIQRKPRKNRGYQPVQFEDRGDKGFFLTVRLQSNRPQDFEEIKTRLHEALRRIDVFGHVDG